jgi:transposase-like protein
MNELGHAAHAPFQGRQGRDTPFLKCGDRFGINRFNKAVACGDQDGDVLDILVQSKRDKKAAKKFFRKLLKRLQYVPSLIVIDKLSYGPANAAVLPRVEHRQEKHQNNRAENSDQPKRLRERVMRRFKSPGHAQRFLSAFGIISSHFRVGRLYQSFQALTVNDLRRLLFSSGQARS